MLSPARALSRGVPTLVGESISATGTGSTRMFSILATPKQEDVVTVQCKGTFAALSGNLEMTLDGGTTWSTFLAFDFAASTILIFNATAGASYRFNISTATTVSVAADILATLA